MTRPPRTDPPHHITPDGTRYYVCAGPSHHGTSDGTAILPEDCFLHIQRKVTYRHPHDQRRYRYRVKQCRRCRYVREAGRHYGGRTVGTYRYDVHGNVPVKRMLYYLDELEMRLGTVTAVAQAVGIDRTTIGLWRRRTWTCMSRQSAMKVLLTLKHVRAAQHGQDIVYRPHANRRRGCTGCGSDLDLFTPGCRKCMTRRGQRLRRARAA